MLHTSLAQLIGVFSGIVVGTLAVAAILAALETIFPKAKGFLARM
jgi:hypothetical protein